MSSNDTCWLYLVRHAATANNLKRPPRLQGRRCDPGLSDQGLEEAARTGAFLAGVRIDRVCSSPLLRARQTAEAIAGPHRLPVHVVEDLTEADVGAWEGRAWDEIERDDPEAYRAFMADASVHPYRDGETVRGVLDRAGPALERLVAENLGRRIVVVAHNVVNRAYLSHRLGIPLAKFRSVPQDNGGVNLLRFRQGRCKVVTINGLFHLDAE
jgi:broad specificity phosphatase PhoE